jgi:hypothetical protein
MFNSRQDELQRFLSWRRKTRFIRHYGGPLLALTLFILCLQFIWLAYSQRSGQKSAVDAKASHAWKIEIAPRR